MGSANGFVIFPHLERDPLPEAIHLGIFPYSAVIVGIPVVSGYIRLSDSHQDIEVVRFVQTDLEIVAIIDHPVHHGCGGVYYERLDFWAVFWLDAVDSKSPLECPNRPLYDDSQLTMAEVE